MLTGACGQKAVGAGESPQVGVLSLKHRKVPDAQVCDQADGVREEEKLEEKGPTTQV